MRGIDMVPGENHPGRQRRGAPFEPDPFDPPLPASDIQRGSKLDGEGMRSVDHGADALPAQQFLESVRVEPTSPQPQQGGIGKIQEDLRGLGDQDTVSRVRQPSGDLDAFRRATREQDHDPPTG